MPASGHHFKQAAPADLSQAASTRNDSADTPRPAGKRFAPTAGSAAGVADLPSEEPRPAGTRFAAPAHDAGQTAADATMRAAQQAPVDAIAVAAAGTAATDALPSPAVPSAAQAGADAAPGSPVPAGPDTTGPILASAVQAGAGAPGIAADYAEADEFKPSTAKRIFNGFINVLTTVIFLAALAFTIVVVATTIASGGNEASLLGWKPYVVLSDSMQQDFQVGDMVVTRAVEDATALQPGDIISFESIDPDAYGEVFTHRIREATEYEGEAAYITYGSTTGDDDAYPALASRVKGKLEFVIPKAGYVFDFFKSPAGYVILVLIPFSILIGLQIRNIVRLVREDREEQQRVLAEEQKRVNEMEAEIERLNRLAERQQQ